MVKAKDKTETSLSAIKFSLQQQTKQSEAIQQLIDTILEVKEDVSEMKQSITQDVQELRDSITLNEVECLELQGAAFAKAKQLANEYFNGDNISSNLFLSKYGQFLRLVYKHLKTTFNIRKYVFVRRIDFIKAINYVNNIDLTDFTATETRMTPKQLEIIELEKDK
ncbi:MAG: ORF6C domain-containing protein [Streptococcaceae bacterium]|jgi:hypothetical protein|nr:ORF6C domain-containing protein [Streptococcaceae bacterium]